MRVRPDADGNTQQELGDRVGSYDRSHHGEARSTRLGALGKDRNVEVERRPEQEGGGAQKEQGPATRRGGYVVALPRSRLRSRSRQREPPTGC